MRPLPSGLRTVVWAEKLFMRLLPRRARRGSTWFGRIGDLAQQPPVWVALAGTLAAAGGSRGRRAAIRGSASYGLAAIVANLIIKPVVGRSRPPGAGEGRPGPVTSSLPSGHTATDLAFALGVAQEIPVLFIPLTILTCASHWSLVRSRGHYPSDVLVGGAVGFVAALGVRLVWSTGGTANARSQPRRGRRRDGRGAPSDLEGGAHLTSGRPA